ncbi:MAG TPA: branched-chain amino acid ABC transporter permease [Desulfomonilaceae bacterium]|nr:branched-chain amino acid ABC transporter permease [Desulfomonilaceae bacterium]
MHQISTAKTFWLFFIPACIAVALIPLFISSEYTLRVSALVIFWIGMSGCWNIMSGYTGYIDFGPVVYFGIGSYTTAICMTRFGALFLPSAILSGVVSALIALPIGIPTLRLRGAYFAIATFAFAETMKQVALEFDRTFGVKFFEGSHGITLPISGHDNMFFFYCVFAVTLAIVLVHYAIEHSKFGYGLKAIHEAEASAEIAGVNTTGVKLRAYVTSAFFLGILGGIEAYWITYITPADAFSVQKTVQMVIMTLLGGMGTFLGPIVGASFFTLLSEVLGTKFVEYYLIMVGAVIIGIILVLPSGIIGTLKARKGIRFI